MKIFCAIEVSDDSDDNPTYQPSDEEKDSNAFSGFDDHEDILNQALNLLQFEESDNEDEGLENNQPVWSEYSGRMREFEFTGNSGILQRQFNNLSTPFDIYSHLFDERLLDLIVAETNTYAQQVMGMRMHQSPRSRQFAWQPTNRDEIRTFFGLIIWMGRLLAKIHIVSNCHDRKNEL